MQNTQKENLRPVVARYHNGKAYEQRKGFFHGWATYVDSDGSTPIAIIEWLDGKCTDTQINDVTFTDR